MRKFITMDDSEFPIVNVRYQKFAPTMVEFEQSQIDMERFITTHANCVLLIDLTDLPFVSSEMRISQAKWQKRNDPVFVKQNIKLAFFSPSSIAQIMLKGVFLIKRPGVAYTVASSMSEGKDWARRQLEAQSNVVQAE